MMDLPSKTPLAATVVVVVVVQVLNADLDHSLVAGK
jgi:hypothetical protein